MGTQEEKEGKSSRSLRRVGNEKVGGECRSELVKAEIGRERIKETEFFLKGGRRKAKMEKGKE